MNAREAVEQGAARLVAAGVPEDRVKMEWWVAEVLGVKRDMLPYAAVDAVQSGRIEAGVRRMEQHEPLQYVIGHTPFLGLDLVTDARALIPRPETEELGARVLDCRDLWSRPTVRIADVGTGTGCLAIALAHHRVHAYVTAIDQSSAALDLARENARRNGVSARIAFVQGDLLDGIAPASLDAVVSNPPYVASAQIPLLEESVRRFEPLDALDGGPDGLDLVRKLAHQAFTVLVDGGRVWLEIGDEQGDAVRDLLSGAGFRHVQVNADLYGQIRFAEGMK